MFRNKLIINHLQIEYVSLGQFDYFSKVSLKHVLVNL